MRFTRLARNKYQRGNAILIVLLLITVIAAVTFSVGYLTMAEIRMESGSEDASIAYFAAEAGIEDGLMRWRLDRNYETPIDKVARVDLSVTEDKIAPTPVLGIMKDKDDDSYPYIDPTDSVSYPMENNKEYYDLKMTYRKPEIPNIGAYDSFGVETTTPVIKADSTLEMEAPEDLNGNFNLKYRFTDEARAKYLSVRIINEDGTINDGSSVVQANVGINEISVLVPQGGEAVIKPWGSDIVYAVKGDPVGTLVDSEETVIESTGYFGSARRKLVAKIDRKSGRLLGIYDFVIYAGGGDISQE